MKLASLAFASLTLVSLATGASGCVESSSPATGAAYPQATLTSAPARDTCAGDSWLPQLLGERPSLVSVMKLDAMKRTRLFGRQLANARTVEMDYLGELQHVPSAMAESYEWRTPNNTPTPRVTVVRQAFGDPRALRAGDGFLYGPPTTLPNGALEYPPAPEALDIPGRARGGRTLFTFADGTWVRVDTWMAQRMRAAFAIAPPPPPPWTPDVAWEVCANAGGVDRSNVWGASPERSVLRFVAGRDVDAEMVFRFASPALAIRAEGEQRVRCQQSQGRQSGDKGIFSLVPQCMGNVSEGVEGPFLRYGLRLAP